MKLSEIVRYRNTLDEITPSDIENHLVTDLDPVIHTVSNHEMQLPHLAQRLLHDRATVVSSIEKFKETLEKTKQEIDQSIQTMEPTYLVNSYRLYYEMLKDTTEYTLNRRLNLSDSRRDYILGRILMHSNWKLTGAVIRPGLEPWIENLVACDPLYVIDTDYGMFEPTKQKFNQSYVNRLRFYKVNDSEKDPILRDLPDNQFSFILAYNFFHYKPFEIFKNYLTEIYKKLDLGGCLAFTFNDCDYHGAVQLCERYFMCYTPGRMVRALCESLGYTISNFYRIDSAISWMEIQKPGRHVSIKGGQTLAEIIEKSK